MPRLPRLLTSTVAAMLLAAWLTSVFVGGSTSRASAQTCLPSPTLLFGEVARVAGTGSALWADIQQVEKTDADQGTSASGQVIQDMLDVASRDGYEWNCETSELVSSTGASLPATPLPGSAASVSPGGPAAPAVPTVPTTAPSPPAAAPAPGATGAAGAAGAAPDSSPTSEPAAAGTDTEGTGAPALAAGASSTDTGTGTHVPTLVLVALVLLSGALLVLVIRWQMGRR